MRHKHPVTEDPVKLVGIAAIAASIGAVVAMLFTPKSGNQVRSGLKRRAEHIKDDAQERLNHTIEEVGDTTEDVKDSLQTTAGKAVKEARTTATKVKDDSVVKRRAVKADAAPRTRKTPPKAQ